MTSANEAASPYELHGILPAMHLRDPVCCGQVVFCTTHHLDRYAIEPTAIQAAVQQLAAQYCDDHGNPLNRLGLVLLPQASAVNLVRHGMPRRCRDAVALCCITRGASLNCHHQQRTSVSESDYFDALPIRLRERGFLIRRPGRRGRSNSLEHYHPALPTYLGTPRDGDFQIDAFLLDAFDRATFMYLAGRKRRALCQVFRAVAIAMHATRILPETDSTYYDVGIRIIGWVSAFETLVHPGKGCVGLSDVLQLVERVHWMDSPTPTPGAGRGSRMRLAHRRYVFRNQSGRPPGRETAPCHLYRRLYDLRNAVAHGNDLNLAEFAANPKRRNGARIDEVAPLLFRGCLVERFRQLGVIKSIPRQGTPTRAEFRARNQAAMSAAHSDEALANVLFGRQ